MTRWWPAITVSVDKKERRSSNKHRRFIQQLVKSNSITDGTNDNSGLSRLIDRSGKYAIVQTEFKDKESCDKACEEFKFVISKYENFADIFYPALKEEDVEALDEIPGLVWYEIDQMDVVPPPKRPEMSDEATRSPALKIVQGGVKKLTGKGVTVAIIDTGIDFTHPDFITYDKDGRPTSRIAYYWDTFSHAHANGVGEPAPVKYPNGTPIGTVYSRDDLNREIRGFAPKIPIRDLDSHGTCCAGIAAGNGNVEKRYTGVAPESDIIAVRVGEGSSLNHTYLMGAICDWLDSVVGESPLVISCSWGGQYGGRDGQMIEERQLSARFGPERKKRAIVFSAGNEAQRNLHTSVKLGPKDKADKLMFVGQGTIYLDFFINTKSEEPKINVGCVGKNLRISSTDTYICPYTKQLILELEIRNPNRYGGVYAYADSKDDLNADVYNYDGRFLGNVSTSEKLIGCPGSALNVLTVGSFDWNDRFNAGQAIMRLYDPVNGRALRLGNASTYSSPGPLRFGDVVKPDLSAPGQWFSAPAPLNISSTRDASGFYKPFNGTSAATPYVAGIVALMFEENPELTFGQIKKRLIESVSKPKSNKKQFGNGKLDNDAINRLFKLDSKK